MDYINHSSGDSAMKDGFLTSFGATDAAAEDVGKDGEILTQTVEDLDFEITPVRQKEETISSECLFPKLQEAVHEKNNGESEGLFDETPAEEQIFAKYCGKSIALPKSETVKLAAALGMPLQECINTLQKGMNYDRLKDNAQTTAAVQEIMALVGTDCRDLGQLLSDVKAQQKEKMLSTEMQSLQKQYPQADNKLLRELAEQKMQIRTAVYEKQAQSKTAQEKALKALWQEAFAQYPELDPQNIDKEIMERAGNGENPLLLFQKKEIEALRLKLAKREQKQKIAQKAFGSVKSDIAEDQDDFLSGFMS